MVPTKFENGSDVANGVCVAGACSVIAAEAVNAVVAAVAGLLGDPAGILNPQQVFHCKFFAVPVECGMWDVLSFKSTQLATAYMACIFDRAHSTRKPRSSATQLRYYPTGTIPVL